ncbi:hypothetical protein CDAR_419721 [Caerostris darwini]|uniref:Uncharacterized protein n=1 Tax=Caerostris darwini TaxID=1538125 RepID=A0AAV4R3W2_9ARAC|nr:hypothetical protein CDAR_419721 [Caerostris darwini]
MPPPSTPSTLTSFAFPIPILGKNRKFNPISKGGFSRTLDTTSSSTVGTVDGSSPTKFGESACQYYPVNKLELFGGNNVAETIENFSCRIKRSVVLGRSDSAARTSGYIEEMRDTPLEGRFCRYGRKSELEIKSNQSPNSSNR